MNCENWQIHAIHYDPYLLLAVDSFDQLIYSLIVNFIVVQIFCCLDNWLFLASSQKIMFCLLSY